jgi:hypothetical protein
MFSLANPRRSLSLWTILGTAQQAALTEIANLAQSDRVVTILGGAMLDDSLRHALEHRFRNSKSTNDRLFKVTGPLGNLGPKIDLAYQLYMFDKQIREAMHGLQEIRNLFAHRLDMTFEEGGEKLKAALAKLVLHTALTVYPNPFTGQDSEYPIEDADSPREKFIVNLKLALIHLTADLTKHAPWSNASLGRP